MTQIAKVNDLTNSSPQIKHPPLWMIMAGCDGQKIDLSPVDADSDQVKCRWASQTEAGGAFTDRLMWPSLSLDQKNCIVYYTGTMDQTDSGVKPIALMIEDFDSNGNVRSSVPVQFLAMVWTPDLNARGLSVYPNWFDEDHEDHIDFDNSAKLHRQIARGRRAEPTYCSSVPVFTGDTPSDQSEIRFSGQLSFTLQAASQLGDILSFSYQAPLGLTCTDVDSAGQVTCTWLPTEEQKKSSHQFCFDAADSLGLKTSRRCISLMIGGKITNIDEMAQAVLPNPGDWFDYGCAGRGTFDPFSKTIGKQLDVGDRAFYSWKRCYNCASDGDASRVEPYEYDSDNDSCGKHHKTFEPYFNHNFLSEFQ